MNRSLAVIVLAVTTASLAAAAGTRQCSDACLGAAGAERTDCVRSASGVFLDTAQGCIGREVVCVDACATERQDCRDATSLGADLLRCDLDRRATELRCRASFPLRPRRLAICIAQARVAGFRCRRGAFQTLRRELKDCRTQFRACAGACRPSQPPGSKECRAEAKTALRDALDQCKHAYRATSSACIDKDVGCVEDCADARETCNAPAQGALDAALAACSAARTDAVAACQAANPGGGAALEACVDSALATAFQCREAALAASLPGFGPCTASYVGCVHGCPSGSTETR